MNTDEAAALGKYLMGLLNSSLIFYLACALQPLMLDNSLGKRSGKPIFEAILQKTDAK